MGPWNVKACQAGFRMGQKHNIIKLLQIFTLSAGLSLLPLVSPPLDAAAQTPAQPSGQISNQISKKMVVLDPGHGGSDTGVKGSAGTLEKEVTLRLARLIENRLKGRYQVALTRTDDYRMPWPDRTGHANHVKADLFVSLHAAGSYSPAIDGLRIYYYAEPAIKVPAQTPTGETVATPWRKVQKPHIPASSILAQRIGDRAAPLTAPHPGTVQAAPVAVLAAPVAVLAGADMPAILIETGYLTNPKQEKNLNDNRYLFKLATAISQGIDDYFNNPGKIAATDLRE